MISTREHALLRKKARRTGVSPSTAVDYRREFRHLYSGNEKKVEIVHAPRMNYLAVDGIGDPVSTKTLAAASQALLRASLAS